MNYKVVVSSVLGLSVIGLIALGLTYRPAINPLAGPPDGSSFPPSEVERGSRLAAVGDCIVCHTVERGEPYAGGLAMTTPFGTLFSTNITPDTETGIGRWSKAAFKRALRDGVSRDGRHLYPAFPYDHYTHLNDADLDALYAFLMTREAVSSRASRNKMIFPLGFRPLLAGWKLMFVRRSKYRPVAAQSEEWNRGAYLVEGLGHCGDCHTPRNLAGAEERARQYQGGVAEGWNCPPLDSSSPVAMAWTESTLYEYLRTGMDSSHGVAGGPMGPVTDNLSTAADSDVRAIALYVASLMRDTPRQSKTEGPIDDLERGALAHPAGSALFAGACAGCHERGAPMMLVGLPALSSVRAIQENDPRNTIQVILQGLNAALGDRGVYMPSFADSLTDGEVAELAAYLRSRYSRRAAWPTLAQTIAKVRAE
jgi:mono/diheme cytochrome c family protein